MSRRAAAARKLLPPPPPPPLPRVLTPAAGPCLSQLLEERDQLTSMSLERQQEVAEHDLVIKTLEPLEAGRKCFRLVRLQHCRRWLHPLVASPSTHVQLPWGCLAPGSAVPLPEAAALWHTRCRAGLRACCCAHFAVCALLGLQCLPSPCTSTVLGLLHRRLARCLWSAPWARCCRQ